MVWQYINFQCLLHKKGLLLTVIQTRGLVETRWCAAAEARSQLITWSSALTLCASYLSRLLSPPPLPPAPPLLSQTRLLITTPVHSYTWYTRVSQNNFLRQNIWHPTFEKSFQSSFFLPLCVRTFLQHLLPKMLSFFHHSITGESFPDFSFYCSFFHPCLTNANYLCRRIFGTSLFNPSQRAPGFTREGGRGGNR